MTSEPLPHWDLSNVYPGLESEPFNQAVGQVKAGMDELDAYLAAHHIARGEPLPTGGPPAVAAAIAGYLDRMNGLQRLVETLESYIYSFFSTDSYNATARRLTSELEVLGVRMESQQVAFRGWIGTLAEQAELFRAALDEPGPVREHAFYLEETARQSRYLMSPAEETLASELSLSGALAWERLQAVVCTQIRVPFERDGCAEELPIAVVQNLRTHPDGEVRRRAFEAEYAAWHCHREPLAACLNGIKATVILPAGRSTTFPTPSGCCLASGCMLSTRSGAKRFSRTMRTCCAAPGRRPLRTWRPALAWTSARAPSGRAASASSAGRSNATWRCSPENRSLASRLPVDSQRPPR
jgi:oligoendopeptidase F